MILSLVILFCSGTLAQTSGNRFRSTVCQKIDSLLSLPELSSTYCGAAIYSLISRSILYQMNGDRLFIPASNLKLVTTAAGLHYLGPDFRFKTEFYYTGKVENGKLEGNLIIKGYGDPTISNRFGGGVTVVLEEWADSLRKYGVKEIDGGILADESYFDGVALGPGWSWDDLSYWYAAEVSALIFNDNCVNLHFRAGKKVGDTLQIKREPVTNYLQWVNQTSTVPNGNGSTFDFYRTPNGNKVIFFGTLPVARKEWGEDFVSVHQPAQFCISVFEQVLDKKNIKVRAGNFESDLSDRKMLFTWHSHPLSEIVSVINKNSQNLYAECLLKALGNEIKGEGSFEAGAVVLGDYLKLAGVDKDRFKIWDGSGLSSMNLLSPLAIIKVLEFVFTQPYYSTFYESLAIPRKDKSVKNRIDAKSGREKMRLKTGFIANAVCLSGYVTDLDGEVYALAVFFNNFTTSKTRLWEIQDRICELIANHSDN